MSAKILDGKATGKAIKAELAPRIEKLKARGITPGLGTVLVGMDPGSQAYVRGKHRDSARLGITSFDIELPETASQAEIEAEVAKLNADPACTAFLVQTPLPRGIDTNRVLSLVSPQKDADGLHPINLGWLALGEPAPLPCTPRGCLELLRYYDIPLEGADVCVIGRGIVAGRTLGLLLTRRTENATVTLCHTATRDLASHVRRADIVIAAAGVPGLITGSMVKPGAAVVDVGITRTPDGLVGDVAPDAFEVAGWVSPVPGGVGPMTRAMLMTNVVEAAERL